MEPGSQQQNDPSQQQTRINLKWDYLKTPAGYLRLVEGILAFCGIVSGAVGASCIYDGRNDFFLFVTIVTLIESLIVIIIFVTQLDLKIAPIINLTITFLINDSISLVFYFVASLLVMLSIGQCYFYVTARVFATLFSLANFLLLTGLVYLHYDEWRQKTQTEEDMKTTPTLTFSSPTVLP